MRTEKRYSLIKIPFIILYIDKIRLLSDKLILIYCNKIYDCSKLDGSNTKKWVGQITWWVNKLGGPNTKLSGLVPGRPTRSTATGSSHAHRLSLRFEVGAKSKQLPPQAAQRDAESAEGVEVTFLPKENFSKFKPKGIIPRHIKKMILLVHFNTIVCI